MAEGVVVLDPVTVALAAEGVRFLVEEKGVKRVSLSPNCQDSWSHAFLAEWQQIYRELGPFYLECYRAG